jgi:hypothetical protein
LGLTPEHVMRFLLALVRAAWLGLFKLHAIHRNVAAGKKSCRPSCLGGSMMGCGAALLLVSAAGAGVFDIRSHAQTTTNAPASPASLGVAVAGDMVTIEEAMKWARPGDTVTIPPGSYRISRLVVTPNTILYAPQGATIIGDMVVRGPQTAIRGFTFAAATVDISNSQSVTIGDCAYDGGTTASKLDGASDALIINNDFHAVTGGVNTGSGLDRSTISGNHFLDCGQCIKLDFDNDTARGLDIVIERNIFMGTARMPVESGPLGAYTENLVLRDNWAADFKNRGPDPGATASTFVAYSVVPTRGVNTVIKGNHAIAGNRGRGAIGIELDGSGEIAGNYIQDFNYGAVVYGAGFNVHENAFVNATQGSVLNYAKRFGRIAGNRTGDQMPKMARPERRIWSP